MPFHCRHLWRFHNSTIEPQCASWQHGPPGLCDQQKPAECQALLGKGWSEVHYWTRTVPPVAWQPADFQQPLHTQYQLLHQWLVPLCCCQSSPTQWDTPEPLSLFENPTWVSQSCMVDMPIVWSLINTWNVVMKSYTVEPPLADTSCKWTPPVSGHQSEVPVTSLRKLCIDDLP